MSGVLDKIGGNIIKKIEENKKEQLKEFKINAKNEVFVLENDNFNYSVVDLDTGEYLKEKELQIKNIFAKAYTEIGEILAAAQERLASHSGGIFEKWYESLGFKKDKVYRLIARYKLVLANSENRVLIENLPLSLSYEISKENCVEELKEKVMSGEIRTLKEFNEAKGVETLEKAVIYIDEMEFGDRIVSFEKKYEDFRKNILNDFSKVKNDRRVEIYNELKRIEKKIEEFLK